MDILSWGYSLGFRMSVLLCFAHFLNPISAPLICSQNSFERLSIVSSIRQTCMMSLLMNYLQIHWAHYAPVLIS